MKIAGPESELIAVIFASSGRSTEMVKNAIFRVRISTASFRGPHSLAEVTYLCQ
jgi:hypothetical protein